MHNSDYIQLSYKLLHLTREDLEVITCLMESVKQTDLNHLSLSLLYLGHNFCTDKQKIFINAPESEFNDQFIKPVRIRFDKKSNPKLFNAIKKMAQGKDRRNYLTANIHKGISIFMELYHLYIGYESQKNFVGMYAITTFLLRYGLNNYVNKANTDFLEKYSYNIVILEKKFNKHLKEFEIPESINDTSSSKNIIISNEIEDHKDYQSTDLYKTDDLCNTEKNQQNTESNELATGGNTNNQQNMLINEQNNDDWLSKSFNPNLL